MYGTGCSPQLIPAALVWLAWTHLPPLWNNSDSVIWLLWQLTLFPHHAPVYPLMMHLLERATNDDAAAMLQGAMLIQHGLQVLGVVWVATAFRGPWRILLVSAAASIGTSYGLFSHGLFTEGLANPLLLLFLGALLRLWRDGPTRRVMVVLALTLLVASLTRYVLIVLAGMPVLFLLLQMRCCGIGCARAGARSGSPSCLPSVLSGPTARSTPGCRCCWMRRPPPCSAAPPSIGSTRLTSSCRPTSAPAGWPRCRRAPTTRNCAPRCRSWPPTKTPGQARGTHCPRSRHSTAVTRMCC